MDSYFNIQNDIKSKIVNARSNFKKSPKDRVTVTYIETRIEVLDSYWNKFENTHQQIITKCDSDELKDYNYFKDSIYEFTEEEYIMYKSELKAKLPSQHVSPVVKEADGQTHCSVQLPKISIPSFSGNYTEWTSFRDLFLSLIHKNNSLDSVQKLHYLKGYLKGEAEQLVRHVPITSANYQVCWDQLEHRYHNKRHLANCILQKLLSQKTLTSESANAIKLLLDTTSECLKGLQSLDIDISTWDVIVVHIISNKLDNESRRLWEVKVNTDCGTKIPTYIQFSEFLEQRFRSIEFLDPKAAKSNVNRYNNVKTFHVASQCCIFCSADHKLYNCRQFAKKDTDDRREFARSNKICFNCLSQGHTVYSCRQTTNCRICRKRHHSLLHPKKVNSTEAVDVSVEKKIGTAAIASSSQNQDPQNICCYTNVPNQGLLPTALVKVESQAGTAFVLRALIDQGSQVSFITEATVQLLGLKKTPVHIDISRLGDDEGNVLPSRWTVKFKLQSRLDPSFVLYVDAYVLKKLTSHLPERKIVQVLQPFSTLELADPTYHLPGKIDLLLGTRIVGAIMLDGLVKSSPGTLVAQKTTLGWILSGEITPPSIPVVCNAIVRPEVNDLLKRFWELESDATSVRKLLTEEEQKCEHFYRNTFKRDENGRYVVKLPFKSGDPKCKYGDTEAVSRKRFLMLERRLLKSPALKLEYSAVINEYIQLGHLELVPQAELENTDAVYLPHHPVVRTDKSTTKVRVVFDASCSACNGVSLNDDLMVGPTLQPDLRQIIMRWRCHPICLSADIIKMYRQVKVSEEDVDYQRILWRNDPDSELQHYRLLRITFGTSSAPYLAVRSLQQVAYDEGNDFPLVSNRVLTDFYVDDLMTGCQSVNEGERIYHQMNQLLGRGGFQLQKWSSNSDELLNKIKSTNISEIEKIVEFKTDTVTKILGLTWNRNLDEFQYSVKLLKLETPVTKRRVISDIARLYDPLGWIAPVITTAKVFIQRLWLSGIGWDDELPSSLLMDWIKFRNNLHELTNFTLPRWIQTRESDRCLELHGFCDASTIAYAAVVYTRSIDRNGHIHISLVTSKTKVAPVKQISVPRLELCSAVLLARLVCEVAGTLNVPKEHIHAWTDSTVVLAWLSSHPSRWKTFVGNRVSEILTVMDNSQWSHVQSKDNPADRASRGIDPAEYLQLNLWKNGPTWLKNDTINYVKEIKDETNLEERKTKVNCYAVIDIPKDDIMSRFSSLRRMIRVIAYCKRFLKPKDLNRTVNLTNTEINKAILTCIKMCQHQHFEAEMNSLKMKGKLNKKGKLTSLSPYLDEDQILRVGGRLHRANILEDMKHPVIIPKKSHFTTLLIADAHERTMHGGPQLMLSYLRSKYWIIDPKSAVRQYFRKCVTCLRNSRRINPPLMGQLPSVRLNAGRPFYQSGVDYAGPISIRTTKGRGYHSTKGYICLFICMVSRAIHIEVVSDMTAQAFIAAFKRFTARRGNCGELWSDNGTTFVGADKELKALFSQAKSSVAAEIADWLVMNGTKWHFIPPHSPNFGGLWEAGVKSTKYHLKRVIGTHTLTFEEMTTVLAQIEACLNSRPISQISNHVEDSSPLTPGHLLIGEPLLLIPENNYENANISSLKRWHLMQRLTQEFWRRWSREYLNQLQQRYKWSHHVPGPNVGDVVLVVEDNLPPARWLYGLITDKHTGSDGVTRVVSLRCKGSIIKRPVSKLIVLPIAE